VAYRSSVQRSPLVHRRGSGACPDTRRSNKPCAITPSTHSVFPDSTSPPKLNPVEPPWYGPVCPVVGEGWHREVSPYPNLRPKAVVRPNLVCCQNRSLPPAHSITSSARARSNCGTVRSSAFAVLRLTTSLNLSGCSIGRSAGLTRFSSSTNCRAHRFPLICALSGAPSALS
jgi:hypothetical protein